MSSFGTEMTFHGSVQFKRPALMRMTAAAPYMGQERRMLMVMGSDKIMWSEVSAGGRTNIMKMDFRTIPTNNPAVAAMQNPLDTIDPKKQLSSAMDRYNFTLLPAIERPAGVALRVAGRPQTRRQTQPPGKWIRPAKTLYWPANRFPDALGTAR